jgi:hypothetical protein
MKEGKMGGACRTHGTDEKCVEILDGEPEGKKRLSLPSFLVLSGFSNTILYAFLFSLVRGT